MPSNEERDPFALGGWVDQQGELPLEPVPDGTWQGELKPADNLTMEFHGNSIAFDKVAADLATSHYGITRQRVLEAHRALQLAGRRK